jgi:hypothetical protein
MASTSTEENAPQVEKMMEEISAGMETVRLEQRLDSLKDVDRKIGDLMIIVTEVSYYLYTVSNSVFNGNGIWTCVILSSFALR